MGENGKIFAESSHDYKEASSSELVSDLVSSEVSVENIFATASSKVNVVTVVGGVDL